MTSKIGQAKRNKGWINWPRPCPLANQMTISLSPYMRDRVATQAMNRLKVMMVVICPSTLKPMTNITSEGFTLPRLA